MGRICRNLAVQTVWMLIVTWAKASPWIVAIVSRQITVSKGGRRQELEHAFCSGGLIHEHYVLTAAHCYRNPNVVSLIAGLDSLNENTDSDYSQKVAVFSWYNHPCYDSYFNPQFDIAVVRSLDTFKLGGKVGLIPLDGDRWPQNQMYTRKCIAVSWGEVKFKDSRQQHPHYVNVTARHGEEACPCAMRHVQKRYICNDPKDIKRGCLGTSGGLMVCNKKAVGVAHTSWTLRCITWDTEKIRCDIPNSVVSWVYICPLLDWIRNVTNAANVPPKPASCSAVNIRQRQNLLMLITPSLLTIVKRLI